MKVKFSSLLLGFLGYLGLTSIADAHSLALHDAGLAAGLSHPFLGLDHLLAMIAVGVWAWQLGGRAVWLLPLSFVGTMSIAAAWALTGHYFPQVEPGIACSILLLGLFISGSVRLPVSAGAVLVGLFALFHGYAHGLELPQTASPVYYGIGFIAATIFLHGFGIWLAKSTRRHQIVQRMAGYSLIAVGGLLLATI